MSSNHSEGDVPHFLPETATCGNSSWSAAGLLGWAGLMKDIACNRFLRPSQICAVYAGVSKCRCQCNDLSTLQILQPSCSSSAEGALEILSTTHNTELPDLQVLTFRDNDNVRKAPPPTS